MPDDLEVKRQRERRRRSKFTAEQRAAVRERQRLYALHRLTTDADFRDRRRKHTRRMYWKHQDKRLEYGRRKHAETRRRCIVEYGGVCVCCGETDYKFLTLDHIKDRREDPNGERIAGGRGGQPLYAWCIRNDFPPGLRVLCYNCNCGRAANHGVCPHEEQRATAKVG